MIIGRTRKLTVRMGEYESMVLTAHMSVDTNEDSVLLDIHKTNAYDPLQINELLDGLLDEALRRDVKDAHLSTTFDPDDTFVHEYHEILEERAEE